MGSRPSPFKGHNQSFRPREMLFALVVHSVGVSEFGHYKAQARESPLES